MCVSLSRKSLPQRLLEPEALLLEPATVEALPALGQQQYLNGGIDEGGLSIGGVASGGGSGDDAKRRQKRNKKKRKGKEPELVEGDALVNTPKMLALVYSSLGLNGLCLLQVRRVLLLLLLLFSSMVLCMLITTMNIPRRMETWECASVCLFVGGWGRAR